MSCEELPACLPGRALCLQPATATARVRLKQEHLLAWHGEPATPSAGPGRKAALEPDPDAPPARLHRSTCLAMHKLIIQALGKGRRAGGQACRASRRAGQDKAGGGHLKKRSVSRGLDGADCSGLWR